MGDDAPYITYIRWAVINNIMNITDGHFYPSRSITRAEIAEMLIAAFDHLSASPRSQRVFTDTDSISDTVVRAIEGIHAAGLTKGCDTRPRRYCPDEKVTRGQAAAFISRAIDKAEPTVGLITNKPGSDEGYMLLNAHRFRTVYLVDNLGREVHSWSIPGRLFRYVRLLEDGNLLAFIRTTEFSPNHDPHIVILNPIGDIVWRYNTRAHHNLLQMPNGNVLVLTNSMMTWTEAIDAGADPKYLSQDGLRYDYLIEVKPTGPDRGDIVWEWSMLDHLIQDYDPTKPNYGAVAEHAGRIDINYSLSLLSDPNSVIWDADFSHANAINYNPDLDQIMISVRHFSELWVIDRNTTTEEAAGEKGDLLYRYGNPRTYGTGSYEDQQLFWQHDTQWIPKGLPGEGNVLIYNNGNEFSGYRRLYSSIDEIHLPIGDNGAYPRTQTGAFKAPDHIWTYAPGPSQFYAPVWSSAQRLSNGNTLIYDDYRHIISQVTVDGETVWKYVPPLVNGPDNQNPNDIPAYQGDYLNARLSNPFWYPTDYSGLKNLDLRPKGPIELYR